MRHDKLQRELDLLLLMTENKNYTAAQLCETYGIVAKAAVAKKAIPDCNLCFVSGAEIQSAIEPYYNVLFTANPASIGGAMPGSDFYYVSAASSNG